MANGLFGGGNGTAENPYLVEDAADLNAVRNNLSAHYKQVADIDLSEYNWIPIGTSDNPFVGTYDGNSFKIHNFKMEYNDYYSDSDVLGMFGYISNSTIKNVEIVNCFINSTDDNDVGVLVGYARNSSIENCKITGTVTVQYAYNCGGIACYIDSSEIKNCTIDMQLTADGDVGGIASYNDQGSIKNCQITVQINTNSGAGGVTQYNYYGTIADCKVTVQFNSESEYNNFGGIVEYNDYGSITNCEVIIQFDTDSVWEAGGIVQYNNYGTIKNCKVNGFITAIRSAAGITAFANGGTIENCQVDATIKVTDSWGSEAAGIAGNCYSASKISQCYFKGTVESASGVTGGIVGNILDTESIIEQCYSEGVVKGLENVGGVIGAQWGGTVKDCYSKASVSGESLIGGLVGVSIAQIQNCYSIGQVRGNYDFGGLVGALWGGTIINSYYNVDVSGCSDTDKGEPRTTEQMTYPYDDNTYIGWDFENVWAHDAGGSLNDGYPILRWQLPQITWVDSELKEIPIMWQSIEFIAPVKEDAEILTAKYRIVTNDIGGYFDNLGFFINLSNEKLTGSEKVFLPIPRIQQGEIREFPVFGAVQEVQIVAAHIMFKETVTGNNSNYVQLQLVNKESDEIISTLTFLEDINAASYEVISFGPVNEEYGAINLYKGVALKVEQFGAGMELPEAILIIEWDLR